MIFFGSPTGRACAASVAANRGQNSATAATTRIHLIEIERHTQFTKRNWPKEILLSYLSRFVKLAREILARSWDK
jgi:hypothetical protein